MRAILIDPTAQTVTEVEFDGKLITAYSMLGCKMVQMDPFILGHSFILDEEGLLKPEPGPFWWLRSLSGLRSAPYAGKALLVRDGCGEWTDCRIPLALFASSVEFSRLRFMSVPVFKEIGE